MKQLQQIHHNSKKQQSKLKEDTSLSIFKKTLNQLHFKGTTITVT
jgi:hypothetical protein